ncbi:hypothetical protein MD484_g6388, partial [Candolleomyces efflorescens]
MGRKEEAESGPAQPEPPALPLYSAGKAEAAGPSPSLATGTTTVPQPQPQIRSDSLPAYPAAPEMSYPPPAALADADVDKEQRVDAFNRKYEEFGECAKGNHRPVTKFGPCGIATSVACAPCGLLALWCDNEKRCGVCDVKLS